MKIAVIGSNMVDLITYTDQIPKEGETLEAPEFEIGCGGKGANQAVAAAKLGSDVMMLTKVGDDLFGQNTIQNFKKMGIDTQYVKTVKNISSGVAPIFVDKNSQNRILIIKGANNYLLPQDILEAEDSLVQCSLIILQLEVPLETVYAAIDFAVKYKIEIILNPAPAIKNLDISYVCKCDFFIPNETELEILTDMPINSKDEIYEAGKVLLNKGLKNLIITLGHRGSIWMTKDKIHYIDPIKVNAVDTSGAGDAFIGCFASEYIKNKNIIKALNNASAYSATSVTGKGTQSSYLNDKQFKEFLSSLS
ncbi:MULTISPECIES: ribokinase [unclassified Gilliamella]|uniref:ribokinase n=1 Tax=unclassified Gilliamella TaxID=2685620 RepID=UPI00226A9974|nr:MULTISPECIES: ribokinase [unclassified Gilliamella]MCX8586156.1 ribokinase [Gilliamella sp. B3562]MCX8685887.1 ribokinase [Gilliamella sp. B2864]